MARQRRHHGLPLADLVQEGTLGLIHAFDKFDPSRGVRFQTYAAWWIRHYMNRALSDKSRTIRIPVHVLDARHAVIRNVRRFELEHGRIPDAGELSDVLPVSPEALENILALPVQPLSLDAPRSAAGGAALSEFIADTNAESPAAKIERREFEASVRSLLRTLTPREQQVIRLRFGFESANDLSFDQIGKLLGLSGERVRQIERDALSRLRSQAGLDHEMFRFARSGRGGGLNNAEGRCRALPRPSQQTRTD